MNRLSNILLCVVLLGAELAKAEGFSCDEKSAEIYLDNTYHRLQNLYGIHSDLSPQIVVHSENLRLPDSDKTDIFGFYDGKNRVLHVACKGEREGSLEVSVGHEATHYYLDQAFGHLPLWLSEGLATYMEVGNNLEDGATYKINKPRLKEFLDLLRHGRVPPLVDILTKNPFSNNPSQYYAAYWALVFSLMHHPDSNVQQQRRGLLLDLLNSPDRDLDSLNKKLLHGLVQDDASTLADWELGWRRQIWRLNSNGE